jgi:HEPN domain-containing protein
MKRSTRRWVERAEEDWEVALREARARKNPHYNLACNLAQQCAEKYLKARLEEAGISSRKTHNLEELLNEILSTEPTWKVFQSEAAYLSTFAVDYRYPGVQATRVMARDAIKSCRKLRQAVRASLGLPS